MKMYDIERYYLNSKKYYSKGWYEAYCEETFTPNTVYRSFNKQEAIEEFKKYYKFDEIAPDGNIYHYSLQENNSKTQSIDCIEESEEIKED